MIKIDGKIENVEPNGRSTENAREFKIGEKSYLAVIHHYQHDQYHNVSVRIFEEVTEGFDSTLAIFEKTLEAKKMEEKK